MSQTLRHTRAGDAAWLHGGIMGTEQPVPRDRPDLRGAAEMGFDMSMFRADAPAFDNILAGASRAAAVGDRLPVRGHAGAASPRSGDKYRGAAGTGIRPSVTCVHVILEEEWATSALRPAGPRPPGMTGSRRPVRAVPHTGIR